MAKVSSPYGLLPCNELSSKYASGGYTEYILTSVPAAMIGFGDIVALVGGTIARITGNQATNGTADASTPIGVFMGASWMDSILGFVNADYVPTAINGTISATNPIKVKVFDDPYATFKIQANRYVDGTATGGAQPALATCLATVGKNVAVTGFTANTTTHQSQLVADCSTAPATTAKVLRIVGFASNPGSAPNDVYPDLLVRFNTGAHAMLCANGL